MIFDTIIIGGGIAGLYSAYILSNKGQRVAIIDKNSYWGGRVLSHHISKHIVYEAGAGRIADIHYKYLDLIEHLGLDDQLVKIPNKKYPVLRGSNWENRKKGLETYITNSDEKLNINFLLKKILNHSKNVSQQHLQTITFYNLAQLVLSHDACQFLYDSFGYISELIELNAYDAVRMFQKDFNSSNNYYVLDGGQSQVTDILSLEIKKLGGIMKLKTVCTDYHYQEGQFHIDIMSLEGTQQLQSNCLILALSKKSLMKFKSLLPIYPELNSVIGHPLMRIYAIYPKNSKTGKVWFHDLPQITTDNPLQYIIPINYDTGLIMISYSDNYMANFWQSSVLLNRLEEDLGKYLIQLFPERYIPKPTYVKSHYWENGAHFYRPGYNSDQISKKILQPFREQNLFIIGETYSQRQAWVEGALETTDHMLDIILNIQHGGNPIEQAAKGLPKFTLIEVSKHNTIDDAWIVIDGYVLDVTKWIDIHPGGKSILKGIGKDYTDEWYRISYHDIAVAFKYFPKYIIGKLV
jgi:hypothetical protein